MFVSAQMCSDHFASITLERDVLRLLYFDNLEINTEVGNELFESFQIICFRKQNFLKFLDHYPLIRFLSKIMQTCFKVGLINTVLVLNFKAAILSKFF